MHVKSMPDGGQRKKTSKLTLFLNGSSRSPTFLNAEFDDLSPLSTPDTSSFSVTLMLSENFPVSMRICHSPRRQSIQQLYICLQETLRQHLVRGTWTKLTPWEPYIQSHGSFCIRSAGQPQIGPHFIWNRDK